MLYFIKVARCGSFTKAAAQCHVTQSTLSAGIQELESLLGAQLFERRGRKTNLSAFGEEVLPEIEAMVEQMETLATRAQTSEEPMGGPLRLGVIPTIAPYILPNLLPQLSQEFPNLNLRLKEEMSEHLINQMNAGKIDMAIMAFPYETEGLQIIPIDEEAFFLALPAAIAPQGASVKSADLGRYRLMLLEEGHCMTDQALNACHIRARASDRQFSASSLQTLLQLVHEGYGATLVPHMALSSSLTKGLNLRHYAITDPTPKRQIGVALPRQSRHLKDAKLLAERVKMTLKRTPNDMGHLSSDNPEHSVQPQSQAG